MKFRILTTCIFLSAGSAPMQANVQVGQLDDFETGTQGWSNSAGNVSQIDSSGSPSGENHLSLISSGSGRGGKMLMWNTDHWTGDFLANGVSGLEFWADNRGPLNSSIPLRLAVYGSGGWFVSPAMPVDNRSATVDEWIRLEYSLAAQDLIWAAGGSGVVDDTMGNVWRLSLLAASGLPPTGREPFVLQGDEFVGDLRIDRLVAVPEASRFAMTWAALTIWAGRRRHRGC